MEHPEERYYRLNRFFLSVSGLWPYQSARSAHLIRAFFIIVMCSSVFFQLSSFITSEITLEYIIDLVPAFIPTFGALCHICARVWHINILKEIFDRIWNDWALQKTEHEVEIMHQHAETSKLLTFYFSLQMYITLVGYILWSFAPDILDFVLPLNESRPRMQPFKIEFFIDEERYFFFIRFHMCIVIFVISIVFTTGCSLFVMISQHICGMCKLLGFLGMIESFQTIPLLLDLTEVVIVLTFSLMQILTISGSLERAIRSIGMTFIQLIYLFLFNYMAQKITNTSFSIYEKVYNSSWYNVVISEQKSLLLIMKRCYQPFILSPYKFYVLSLQSYGMILQTVFSYFMVIKQI